MMSEHPSSEQIIATRLALRQAVASLAVEVPGEVWDDLNVKIEDVLAALAAETARAEQWNALSLETANELSRALGRYRDVGELLADRDALATRLEQAQAVCEAARRFVATTSYYRQPKTSRPEFETLAVVLAALQEAPPNEQRTQPNEDWYCSCREIAPDRLGTIPVLRPARQERCFICGEEAPWLGVPHPDAPPNGEAT